VPPLMSIMRAIDEDVTMDINAKFSITDCRS